MLTKTFLIHFEKIHSGTEIFYGSEFFKIHHLHREITIPLSLNP